MYHSKLPDDPNMPESVRKSKEACALWLATPMPKTGPDDTYDEDSDIFRKYRQRQEAARKASSEMDKEGRDYIRKYKLSLGCIPKETGPVCCAECFEQGCTGRIIEY